MSYIFNFTRNLRVRLLLVVLFFALTWQAHSADPTLLKPNEAFVTKIHTQKETPILFKFVQNPTDSIKAIQINTNYDQSKIKVSLKSTLDTKLQTSGYFYTPTVFEKQTEVRFELFVDFLEVPLLFRTPLELSIVALSSNVVEYGDKAIRLTNYYSEEKVVVYNKNGDNWDEVKKRQTIITLPSSTAFKTADLSFYFAASTDVYSIMFKYKDGSIAYLQTKETYIITPDKVPTSVEVTGDFNETKPFSVVYNTFDTDKNSLNYSLVPERWGLSNAYSSKRIYLTTTTQANPTTNFYLKRTFLAASTYVSVRVRSNINLDLNNVTVTMGNSATLAEGTVDTPATRVGEEFYRKFDKSTTAKFALIQIVVKDTTVQYLDLVISFDLFEVPDFRNKMNTFNLLTPTVYTTASLFDSDKTAFGYLKSSFQPVTAIITKTFAGLLPSKADIKLESIIDSFDNTGNEVSRINITNKDDFTGPYFVYFFSQEGTSTTPFTLSSFSIFNLDNGVVIEPYSNAFESSNRTIIVKNINYLIVKANKDQYYRAVNKVFHGEVEIQYVVNSQFFIDEETYGSLDVLTKLDKSSFTDKTKLESALNTVYSFDFGKTTYLIFKIINKNVSIPAVVELDINQYIQNLTATTFDQPTENRFNEIISVGQHEEVIYTFTAKVGLNYSITYLENTNPDKLISINDFVSTKKLKVKEEITGTISGSTTERRKLTFYKTDEKDVFFIRAWPSETNYRKFKFDSNSGTPKTVEETENKLHVIELPLNDQAITLNGSSTIIIKSEVELNGVYTTILINPQNNYNDFLKVPDAELLNLLDFSGQPKQYRYEINVPNLKFKDVNASLVTLLSPAAKYTYELKIKQSIKLTDQYAVYSLPNAKSQNPETDILLPTLEFVKTYVHLFFESNSVHNFRISHNSVDTDISTNSKKTYSFEVVNPGKPIVFKNLDDIEVAEDIKFSAFVVVKKQGEEAPILPTVNTGLTSTLSNGNTLSWTALSNDSVTDYEVLVFPQKDITKSEIPLNYTEYVTKKTDLVAKARLTNTTEKSINVNYDRGFYRVLLTARDKTTGLTRLYEPNYNVAIGINPTNKIESENTSKFEVSTIKAGEKKSFDFKLITNSDDVIVNLQFTSTNKKIKFDTTLLETTFTNSRYIDTKDLITNATKGTTGATEIIVIVNVYAEEFINFATFQVLAIGEKKNSIVLKKGFGEQAMIITNSYFNANNEVKLRLNDPTAFLDLQIQFTKNTSIEKITYLLGTEVVTIGADQITADAVVRSFPLKEQGKENLIPKEFTIKRKSGEIPIADLEFSFVAHIYGGDSDYKVISVMNEENTEGASTFLLYNLANTAEFNFSYEFNSLIDIEKIYSEQSIYTYISGAANYDGVTQKAKVVKEVAANTFPIEKSDFLFDNNTGIMTFAVDDLALSKKLILSIKLDKKIEGSNYLSLIVAPRRVNVKSNVVDYFKKAFILNRNAFQTSCFEGQYLENLQNNVNNKITIAPLVEANTTLRVVYEKDTTYRPYFTHEFKLVDSEAEFNFYTNNIIQFEFDNIKLKSSKRVCFVLNYNYSDQSQSAVNFVQNYKLDVTTSDSQIYIVQNSSRFNLNFLVRRDRFAYIAVNLKDVKLETNDLVVCLENPALKLKIAKANTSKFSSVSERITNLTFEPITITSLLSLSDLQAFNTVVFQVSLTEYNEFSQVPTEFTFTDVTTSVPNFDYESVYAVKLNKTNKSQKILFKSKSSYGFEVSQIIGKSPVSFTLSKGRVEAAGEVDINKVLVFDETFGDIVIRPTTTPPTERDEIIELTFKGEETDTSDAIVMFYAYASNEDYFHKVPIQEVSENTSIERTWKKEQSNNIGFYVKIKNSETDNLKEFINRVRITSKSADLTHVAFKTNISKDISKVVDLPTSAEALIKGSRSGLLRSVVINLDEIGNSYYDSNQVYVSFSLSKLSLTNDDTEDSINITFYREKIFTYASADKYVDNVSIEISRLQVQEKMFYLKEDTKLDTKGIFNFFLQDPLPQLTVIVTNNKGEEQIQTTTSTEVTFTNSSKEKGLYRVRVVSTASHFYFNYQQNVENGVIPEFTPNSLIEFDRTNNKFSWRSGVNNEDKLGKRQFDYSLFLLPNGTIKGAVTVIQVLDGLLGEAETHTEQKEYKYTDNDSGIYDSYILLTDKTSGAASVFSPLKNIPINIPSVTFTNSDEIKRTVLYAHDTDPHTQSIFYEFKTTTNAKYVQITFGDSDFGIVGDYINFATESDNEKFNGINKNIFNVDTNTFSFLLKIKFEKTFDTPLKVDVALFGQNSVKLRQGEVFSNLLFDEVTDGTSQAKSQLVNFNLSQAISTTAVSCELQVDFSADFINTLSYSRNKVTQEGDVAEPVVYTTKKGINYFSEVFDAKTIAKYKDSTFKVTVTKKDAPLEEASKSINTNVVCFDKEHYKLQYTEVNNYSSFPVLTNNKVYNFIYKINVDGLADDTAVRYLQQSLLVKLVQRSDKAVLVGFGIVTNLNKLNVVETTPFPITKDSANRIDINSGSEFVFAPTLADCKDKANPCVFAFTITSPDTIKAPNFSFSFFVSQRVQKIPSLAEVFSTTVTLDYYSYLIFEYSNRQEIINNPNLSLFIAQKHENIEVNVLYQLSGYRLDETLPNKQEIEVHSKNRQVFTLNIQPHELYSNAEFQIDDTRNVYLYVKLMTPGLALPNVKLELNNSRDDLYIVNADIEENIDNDFDISIVLQKEQNGLFYVDFSDFSVAEIKKLYSEYFLYARTDPNIPDNNVVLSYKLENLAPLDENSSIKKLFYPSGDFITKRSEIIDIKEGYISDTKSTRILIKVENNKLVNGDNAVFTDLYLKKLNKKQVNTQEFVFGETYAVLLDGGNQLFELEIKDNTKPFVVVVENVSGEDKIGVAINSEALTDPDVLAGTYRQFGISARTATTKQNEKITLKFLGEVASNKKNVVLFKVLTGGINLSEIKQSVQTFTNNSDGFFVKLKGNTDEEDFSLATKSKQIQLISDLCEINNYAFQVVINPLLWGGETNVNELSSIKEARIKSFRSGNVKRLVDDFSFLANNFAKNFNVYITIRLNLLNNSNNVYAKSYSSDAEVITPVENKEENLDFYDFENGYENFDTQTIFVTPPTDKTLTYLIIGFFTDKNAAGLSYFRLGNGNNTNYKFKEINEYEYYIAYKFNENTTDTGNKSKIPKRVAITLASFFNNDNSTKVFYSLYFSAEDLTTYDLADDFKITCRVKDSSTDIDWKDLASKTTTDADGKRNIQFLESNYFVYSDIKKESLDNDNKPAEIRLFDILDQTYVSMKSYEKVAVTKKEIEHLDFTNYSFFVVGVLEKNKFTKLYNPCLDVINDRPITFNSIFDLRMGLNALSTYYLSVDLDFTQNDYIVGVSNENFSAVASAVKLIDQAKLTQLSKIIFTENSNNYNQLKPVDAAVASTKTYVEILVDNTIEQKSNSKLIFSLHAIRKGSNDYPFVNLAKGQTFNFNNSVLFKGLKIQSSLLKYKINFNIPVGLVKKISIFAADGTSPLQEIKPESIKEDVFTSAIVNVKASETTSFIVFELDQTKLLDPTTEKDKGKALSNLSVFLTEFSGNDNFQIVAFSKDASLPDDNRNILKTSTLKNKETVNLIIDMNTYVMEEISANEDSFGLITLNDSSKNVFSAKFLAETKAVADVQVADFTDTNKDFFNQVNGGLFFTKKKNERYLLLTINYENKTSSPVNAFTLQLHQAPKKLSLTKVDNVISSDYTVSLRTPKSFYLDYSAIKDLTSEGDIVFYTKRDNVAIALSYNNIAFASIDGNDAVNYSDLAPSDAFIVKIPINDNMILSKAKIFLTVLCEDEANFTGKIEIKLSNSNYSYVMSNDDPVINYNIAAGTTQTVYVANTGGQSFGIYAKDYNSSLGFKFKKVPKDRPESITGFTIPSGDGSTFKPNTSFTELDLGENEEVLIELTSTVADKAAIGILYISEFLEEEQIDSYSNTRRLGANLTAGINYTLGTNVFFKINTTDKLINFVQSTTDKLYKFTFEQLEGVGETSIKFDDEQTGKSISNTSKSISLVFKNSSKVKLAIVAPSEDKSRVIRLISAPALDGFTEKVINAEQTKKVTAASGDITVSVVNVVPGNKDFHNITLQTGTNAEIQTLAYSIYVQDQIDKDQNTVFVDPAQLLENPIKLLNKTRFDLNYTGISNSFHVVFVLRLNTAAKSNVMANVNADTDPYYNISFSQDAKINITKLAYTSLNFSTFIKRHITVNFEKATRNKNVIISLFKSNLSGFECTLSIQNDELKTKGDFIMAPEKTVTSKVIPYNELINTFDITVSCVSAPTNQAYILVSFVDDSYLDEAKFTPAKDTYKLALKKEKTGEKSITVSEYDAYLKDVVGSDVKYSLLFKENDTTPISPIDLLSKEPENGKYIDSTNTIKFKKGEFKNKTLYSFGLFAIDKKSGLVGAYQTKTFQDDTEDPKPDPVPVPSDTSDTTATSSSGGSGSNTWWIVLLIILGVIILIAVVLLLVKYFMNQRRSGNEDAQRNLLGDRPENINRDSINE